MRQKGYYRTLGKIKPPELGLMKDRMAFEADEAPGRFITPTQRAFLAAYIICAGRVGMAAQTTKISPHNHYAWMRDSEAYRRAFLLARPMAAQALLDEAIRRARDGVLEPVYYKGEVVDYKYSFSDALMTLLLKGFFPEMFKERVSVGGDGSAVGITDPGRNEISDEALKALRAIDDQIRFLREQGIDPVALIEAAKPPDDGNGNGGNGNGNKG